MDCIRIHIKSRRKRKLQDEEKNIYNVFCDILKSNTNGEESQLFRQQASKVLVKQQNEKIAQENFCAKKKSFRWTYFYFLIRFQRLTGAPRTIRSFMSLRRKKNVPCEFLYL